MYALTSYIRLLLAVLQDLASDSMSMSTADGHAASPPEISPALFDELRDAVVECCRVRHWAGFCSHPLFYKYIQVMPAPVLLLSCIHWNTLVSESAVGCVAVLPAWCDSVNSWSRSLSRCRISTYFERWAEVALAL